MSGTVAAGQAAVEFFLFAKKQGWLDKAINVFKKKHRILILGSTGVGKTNLLTAIQETTPEAISHMNRTEFAQEHSLQISGSPFIFIDTPGQISHDARRLEAIRSELGEESLGVINVVCNGYHEYRTSKMEALDSQGQADADYLEKHRDIEIDAVNSWIGLLGSRHTTDWILTVITKADLWWHNQEQVFDHYENGPYANAIAGDGTLHPTTIEFASVFHKFYSSGSLSGDLDDRDKARMRANLLRMLLESIGNAKLGS